MPVLRIASITLLAVLTATAATDGSRHCRRATNGRAFRSRTDHDHHTHATTQALEDSLAVVAADESRTGGQTIPDAALANSMAAFRLVFSETEAVPALAAIAPRSFLLLSAASRGPPLFLS